MLSIGGANVAGSFRNFSAQYIILEEIDEYPEDLEGQGNPINLAKARADKFGNSRKFYILSSPTIVDGPIDTEFKNSNQQYYHIPCPYCGGMQYFEVDRLRYKKTAQWTVDGHVTYECKHCNKLIEEYHKTEMMALKNGATWIAHNPDHPKQGFHISSMYSPLGWLSWASMAADELEAQKENDVAKLKTYRNTRCALPWDDIMIEQQTTGAYERHKDFTGSIVPMAALALTAAVDVHGDRLEVEVAAWAPLEESWSMEYHIIPGDPEDRSTWEALDEFRKQLWRHESGALLGISKITVDTGYKTDEVYAYVRPRRHSGVVPVKGSKLPGKPVISKRPTKQKLPAGDILLYEIGTDTAKDSIYWRLNNQKIEPVPEPYIYAPLALAEPVKLLPGKMHFPKDREDEYFRQLFGEKVVKKKKSGRIVRSYEQIREDNHALDLRVYNLAALRILRPNWARLAKEIAARAEKERALADPKVAEAAVPEKAVQQLSTAPEKKFNARPRGHNRGGWVTQGTMWRPAR
jgi:phage terminase large subunit GpA-like protein